MLEAISGHSDGKHSDDDVALADAARRLTTHLHEMPSRAACLSVTKDIRVDAYGRHVA